MRMSNCCRHFLSRIFSNGSALMPLPEYEPSYRDAAFFLKKGFVVFASTESFVITSYTLVAFSESNGQNSNTQHQKTSTLSAQSVQIVSSSMLLR